jgi:hypothetical protein
VLPKLAVGMVKLRSRYAGRLFAGKLAEKAPTDT